MDFHPPVKPNTTTSAIQEVRQSIQYSSVNYGRFQRWCVEHFGSLENFRSLEYCQFEHPSIASHGSRIFITKAYPAWNTWYVVGVTSGDDTKPSSEQYLVNINSNEKVLYVFADSEHLKLIQFEYCQSSSHIDSPLNVYCSQRFFDWLNLTSSSSNR